MAIAKGPGLKKKDKMPTSKVGSDSKSGQTVAPPGYKMGLVRNQADTKNPTKTKTLGEGAKAVSVTTRAGIIAPKPVTPAAKAPVAAKRKGKSAVGKAIQNVKDAVTSSGNNKPFISTRQKISRSKRTGKSCN